jgi:hypothetical protein
MGVDGDMKKTARSALSPLLPSQTGQPRDLAPSRLQFELSGCGTECRVWPSAPIGRRGSERVLKYHLHIPPRAVQIGRREPRDVPSAELNFVG